MDTHRADSTHRPVTFRLRNAHHADDDQLQAFDLGDLHEPWLREVADIVSGLLEWRANPDAVYLDRRVVVAVDDDDRIVGVCAHECIATPAGLVDVKHRYLMATAISRSQQRSGVARLLVESVLAECQRLGGPFGRVARPPTEPCNHTVQSSNLPDGRRDLPGRRPAVRAVRPRAGLSGRLNWQDRAEVLDRLREAQNLQSNGISIPSATLTVGTMLERWITVPTSCPEHDSAHRSIAQTSGTTSARSPRQLGSATGTRTNSATLLRRSFSSKVCR